MTDIAILVLATAISFGANNIAGAIRELNKTEDEEDENE